MVSNMNNDGSFFDVLGRANNANPYFADSCITDIAMLGSHDTFTYDINLDSEVNPYENNETLVKIKEIVGPILKVITGSDKALSIVYCLGAKAQQTPIMEQLNSGVRYLDVRLSYHEYYQAGVLYKTCYTYHTLISGEFDKYLMEIIRFLYNHPTEYVVVDFAELTYEKKQEDAGQEQIDYSNKVAEYIANVRVEECENKCLFDFCNFTTSTDSVKHHVENLTWRNVTNNGTKGGVVLIGSKVNVTDDRYLKYFPDFEKSAIWHNCDDSHKVLKLINNAANKNLIKGIPDSGKKIIAINQTQTVLGKDKYVEIAEKIVVQFPLSGFSWKEVYQNILNSEEGLSLLSSAVKHNDAVVSNQNFQYWLSVMPIIWFDNVTSESNDFNNKINTEILEYNKEIGNKPHLIVNPYYQIEDKATFDRLLPEYNESLDIILQSGNNLWYGNYGWSEIDSEISINYASSCADVFKPLTFIKTGDNQYKIKLSSGLYLKRKGNSTSYSLDVTWERSEATSWHLHYYSDGRNFNIFENTVCYYGLKIDKEGKYGHLLELKRCNDKSDFKTDYEKFKFFTNVQEGEI